MTTKTIGGTVLDLAGGPINRAQITIRLLTNTTFRNGDAASLVQLYTVFSNTSGIWTAVVECNDTITPAGTIYEVKEDYDLGGWKTYLIQVLSTLPSGTNQVLGLIVPEMSPVGVVNDFLTKAEGDALYANNVGPSGPAGPAGQGVPTGGSVNQVLSKKTAADYDTQWTNPAAGGFYQVVKLEGTAQTARNAIDFRDTNGVDFVVTDDAAGDATRVSANLKFSGVTLATTYAVAATDGIAQQTAHADHSHGSPPRELPTGGSTGQVLQKNTGTNYDVGWQTPSAVPTNLDSLTDVVIASPTDTQVLQYETSSSQWKNKINPGLHRFTTSAPGDLVDGQIWFDSDLVVSPLSSVPIYTSAAQRDAAFPNPPDGALCSLLGMLQTRMNGVWEFIRSGGSAVSNTMTAATAGVITIASSSTFGGISVVGNRFRVSDGGNYQVWGFFYWAAPAAGSYFQGLINQWRGVSNIGSISMLTYNTNANWNTCTAGKYFSTLAGDEFSFEWASPVNCGPYAGSTFTASR